MEEVMLIKLGGSIITDKSRPFTAKPRRIHSLAREILRAQQKSLSHLIIGHGSGSFGHVPARKYQTHMGSINDQSALGMVITSYAAVEINRLIMKIFINKGLKTKSFSPSSFILAKACRPFRTFIDPIKHALSEGFTPVIYGDVLMDIKQGFCIFSSEMTLGLLATKFRRDFKIRKVIYLTNTNGVLDQSGRTISRINSRNVRDIRKNIKGSKGIDVTGGMLHKVEESFNLSKKLGIDTLIINGTQKDSLYKAILGRRVVGTEIKAGN